MLDKTDTYRFDQIELFEPISLGEMDKVKLMNRTDTKYWFHARHLYMLLRMVQDNYFILNMHNQVALPYSTTYYDTDINNMFIAHHNGKLNRYKIRRRSYVSSGISFLEVKFKTNKGRTIKKRIPSNFGDSRFNEKEHSFLNEITPFAAENLTPTLINNFSRLTLVNKNFNERCTIDFNLNFKTNSKQISLNNLVILEIKVDGSPAESPLARALRDKHIHTSGFSKYCIGRTVTDAGIKRNAFKNKVRKIEKIIDKSNLYNF
jgi:hypothetical protein